MFWQLHRALHLEVMYQRWAPMADRPFTRTRFGFVDLMRGLVDWTS